VVFSYHSFDLVLDNAAVALPGFDSSPYG
jgi:hypothetical protein